MSSFRRGQPVVYLKEKEGSRPGPRAQDVSAAPRGETYHYQVRKYWVVDHVLPDGQVCVRTRRGKTHVIDSSSNRLRPASLWERLLQRARFPH